MSDESTTNTPQPEGDPGTSVTHEALSAAWDGVTANEPEATTEANDNEQYAESDPPEPEGEDQDQQEEANPPDEKAQRRERRDLGRKVKDLTEKFDALLEKLSAAPQSTQSPAPAEHTQPPHMVDYGDAYLTQRIDEAIAQGIIPEIPTTAHEIAITNRFLAKVEQDRTAQQEIQYAKGYLGYAESVKSSVDPELHAEILDAITKDGSPFNVTHSNGTNPVLDARINYAEARLHILEQKLSKTKGNPFKGKPSAVPTGVSTTSTEASQDDVLAQLDDRSREFARRSGMSDKSIRDALSTPLPLHLTGLRAGR